MSNIGVVVRLKDALGELGRDIALAGCNDVHEVGDPDRPDLVRPRRLGAVVTRAPITGVVVLTFDPVSQGQFELTHLFAQDEGASLTGDLVVTFPTYRVTYSMGYEVHTGSSWRFFYQLVESEPL